MKNVLLMTRNEGSDHIIEALMEHKDVHVLLEVAGTIEEKKIAERYPDRIDRICVYCEGDLFNLEDVTGLDYDLIEACREIESDFEDGTGRFVDNYALVKYKYYTSIVFWNDFFQKNKIDYMIIRGLTHGTVHDSIPIYFAIKLGIPCYQLENNYFSTGCVFLPARREYMQLNLGMCLQADRSMFYPLEFGTLSESINPVRNMLRHGLYKLGGLLFVQLCSDLLHGNKKHKLFGIDGSEHTTLFKIFSYIKYKRTEAYLKRIIQPFDAQKKYVIYYLQFEPEATTQVRCMLKSQLIAIKMLSEALPPGWVLYVKEHPHQFLLNKAELSMDYCIVTANKYKNRAFYDKIKSMKNTILIDPLMSSSHINQNAMAIATFNGTVAIEATKLKKPILLFGADNSWMRYCRDVVSIQSYADCQNVLRRVEEGWSPQYDDLEQVVNQYGYPLTPEGNAAVIHKIVAHAHSLDERK